MIFACMKTRPLNPYTCNCFYEVGTRGEATLKHVLKNFLSEPIFFCHFWVCVGTFQEPPPSSNFNTLLNGIASNSYLHKTLYR